MMKLIFTILILTSFLAVAVFGFSSMNSGHGGERFCLAEILNSSGCLAQRNTFTLAAFHAGVYKDLSLTMVSAAVVLLMILCAVLSRQIYAAMIVSKLNIGAALPQYEPKIQKKLFDFLALCEKRDPQNTL